MKQLHPCRENVRSFSVKPQTCVGSVSYPPSSEGTSSYLSNEQHDPPGVKGLPPARSDCSCQPRSGSYFMFAEMRLRSARIDLPSIHPGLEDLFTQTDFPPSRAHCFSGSIAVTRTVEEQWGGRQPSTGFYFEYHSFPECCHPPGDICFVGSFGGATRPISKSERAVG